ncbi:MAG: RDD family protein [Phycisphaerae bacterium]|nr:RDD family protein [Phycisphaerae bacterium]
MSALTYLAADEQTLWLVWVDAQRSRAYRRGVNEEFQPGAELNAPVVSMAATRGLLYAFSENGAFYSWADEGWSPELNLPGRVRAVDMAGSETDLYALIPSPSPGQLPRLENGLRPATSQPFDPEGAPLSVVRYDSRGWIAVAPAPAFLTGQTPPRLHPRLYVTRELKKVRLYLFWRSTDGERIQCRRLNTETGVWHDGGRTPVLSDLTGFWITTVSRVPTLITAKRAAEGGEQPRAFRLLRAADGDAVEWRPAPLQLSELPLGVQPAEYQAAFGFNQHVALLMTAGDRAAYVRFGRTDAAPAEPTVTVAEVFADGHLAGLGPGWLQMAARLLLFGILAALLLLRRGAIFQAIELPAGCAAALTFQRFLGCAIDLVPFIVVGAVVIGVDWKGGLRELSGWALGGSGETLPPLKTLLWWGFSTGACAVYCLVMELLTRRTVGKVLTGTRLLSESGRRPGVGPIVIRNLLRFVELQPPLWVLGFVVLLSRSRQRSGDIFAGTVVVRRVQEEKRIED